MEYNKKTGTLLFLLLFTTGQCENNIEKTLFVNAGAHKGEKLRILRVLYRNL